MIIKTDRMITGRKVNGHEGNVTGNDFCMDAVNAGRKAFVKWNGKYEISSLISPDMCSETVCLCFKRITGVFFLSLKAFFPVRNMMDIQRLERFSGLREPGLIQCDSSQKRLSNGFCIHGLFMRSGTYGLKESHWQLI